MYKMSYSTYRVCGGAIDRFFCLFARDYLNIYLSDCEQYYAWYKNPKWQPIFNCLTLLYCITGLIQHVMHLCVHVLSNFQQTPLRFVRLILKYIEIACWLQLIVGLLTAIRLLMLPWMMLHIVLLSMHFLAYFFDAKLFKRNMVKSFVDCFGYMMVYHAFSRIRESIEGTVDQCVWHRSVTLDESFDHV